MKTLKLTLSILQTVVLGLVPAIALVATLAA